MRFHLSPASVLAGAALFFALGGSALAVSEAVRPQPRCAPGAVRGIASVTGDPSKGMANLPDQYSSARVLFGRTFNCAGGAVQVRRVAVGVFEVRFAGNGARSALVSASGALASLEAAGDAFRVRLYVPGRDDEAEVPFTVVAV
jgi:hypothetical protein